MSASTAPSPLLRLPTISLRWSVVLCLCMVATAMLAVWATPKFADAGQAPSLDATVPRQFGDWREVPSPFLQVSLTTGTETNMDQPYDQVVMRTYVNNKGEQIMLALAWGQRQKQEVKIHRPDLCYVAQGFRVRSLEEAEFTSVPGPNGKPVNGKRMYTDTSRFGEAVSYWMRIGSLYSENAVETRTHIFKEGLQGRIPDGILVRASMRVGSEEQASKAWPILESFTKQMVEATPEATRKLLLGPEA